MRAGGSSHTERWVRSDCVAAGCSRMRGMRGKTSSRGGFKGILPKGAVESRFFSPSMPTVRSDRLHGVNWRRHGPTRGRQVRIQVTALKREPVPCDAFVSGRATASQLSARLTRRSPAEPLLYQGIEKGRRSSGVKCTGSCEAPICAVYCYERRDTEMLSRSVAPYGVNERKMYVP